MINGRNSRREQRLPLFWNGMSKTWLNLGDRVDGICKNSLLDSLHRVRRVCSIEVGRERVTVQNEIAKGAMSAHRADESRAIIDNRFS